MDVYGLRDRISPRDINCNNNLQLTAVPGDDDFLAVKDDNQWDDNRALSEAGHYQTAVKRNNFIELFLDGYNADKYVAEHLYGAINNMSVAELDKEDLDDILGTSAEFLSNSFVGNVKRMN